MLRTLLILALFPLAFLTATAYADLTSASRLFSAEATTRPIVLVRVLALDGIGPDLREHRLFSRPEGLVTTLDSLGRVGYQVRAKGLAEGGYHTLFVQLADEYQLIQSDGTRLSGRFSEESRPTRRRVRGMVMVRDGKATPLRMLETPSYYGADRGKYSPEWEED